MKQNKVDRYKSGIVQQSLKVRQGQQTTLALWRQCNDVKTYEISFQKSVYNI